MKKPGWRNLGLFCEMSYYVTVTELIEMKTEGKWSDNGLYMLSNFHKTNFITNGFVLDSINMPRDW